MKATFITQNRLRELLSYDKETGKFNWLLDRKGQLNGRPAGHNGECGYVLIRVDQRLYRAHRLAWLYEYGKMPELYLDHINGDKSDNRLSNLREATHASNLHNSRLKKSNTSGFKGVCWIKRREMWRARITVNRRIIELGFYQTPEEAHAVYCKAAAIHHGDFMRAA